MSELSDKILQGIKDKSAKPRPRWSFQLRESGVWIGVVLALIFLGIMSSLAWYFAGGMDMGLLFWLTGRSFIYGRGPRFIFIGVILLFLALYYGFRSTKQGYRRNWYELLGIFVAVGIVLSLAFSYLGVGRWADHSLSGLPAYQSQEEFMLSVWQRPQEGRIAGEIVAVTEGSSLSLKDFDGKIWEVDFKRAIWRHSLIPETGLKIKMIGNPSGNIFRAEDIRPWLPPATGCQMMEKHQFGGCGLK